MKLQVQNNEVDVRDECIFSANQRYLEMAFLVN